MQCVNNFRFSAQHLVLVLVLVVVLLLLVLSFLLRCYYFCHTGHIRKSGSELVPMTGHVVASSKIS
jgi:hypothetical protein